MRRAFYPLLVASQTIPPVAIAPILVVWFGFGIGPKLAPDRADLLLPDHGQHARRAALGRSRPDQDDADARSDQRAQTLRRAEFPWALPFAFSGARIAVAVAVIGAVFAEWAGADDGLGHLIQVSQRRALDRPDLRRHRRALGDGDRPVRGARARRAPRRQLERGTRSMSLPPRSAAPPASVLHSPSAWRPAARSPRTSVTAEAQPFDLALDFYVNPDHAGIYMGIEQGFFDARGPRRRRRGSPPTRPPRSRRSPPGAPTWRSPTSPRCCSPASRAWTCRRGGAGRRAADLAHHPARRPAIAEIPPTCSGKTVATAGHPLPVGLPRDDPGRGRGSTATPSRRSASASTCCRRSSAARPTRSWAASGTSRASI